MIPWLLFLPLAAAVACWLLPRQRAMVAIGAASLNLLHSFVLGWSVLNDGVLTFSFGESSAPLEMNFMANGLSAILLLTTAVTGMAVVVYAWFYFRLEDNHLGEEVGERFWGLWLALMAGLNGLLLSGNLILLFVYLELVGGAAVGMVAVAGNRQAWVAAMRYYFARLPGSLAFLLGVALLYAAYGTLDLWVLASLLEASPLVLAAAALMMFGVVVKASLFPLHFWLPAAHAAAIGPASAMLSGVVVKGPFYVSIRLWFELFPEITTPSAAQFIGALGAVGIIWGAVQALRNERLKLIIAYSTVSQMGFLFLLFPLLTGPPGTAWTTAAWTGGIYQAMSHAMAKAALLMAAGGILYALGSDRLKDMHGIASRMPTTTFVIALSCVTLIGLPPSGGFIAKWLLLSAAIESGQWWWVVPLAGGGLLTAAYAFLMLSYAFRSRAETPVIRPVPRVMEGTALVLALGAILIGLRVQEPMQLIAPMADPASVEETVP